MSTTNADINVNVSNNSSRSAENITDRRCLRKLWKKLAKQKARLVFLLKCRRSNITPRFIMDRVTHLLQKYSGGPSCIRKKAKSEGDRIKKSLLNIEVSECIKQISGIENRTDKLELILSKRLSIVEFTQLMKDIELLYMSTLKGSNKTHQEKYKALGEKQQTDAKITFDQSFIKNLTDVPIPREVMNVLSLGPKFAIRPEVPPIIDLASDVEYTILKKIPESKQREARGETLYTLSQFARQNHKLSRIEQHLQRAARITRKFMKDNPEIMVSNSDKGGVTIISKKEDYLSKIRTMLADPESFTPLTTDPTNTVKNKVNGFLDKLYHANIIPNKLKKSLKSWNTIPPRLFGQIKYHKPGYPVRLIVSTINSAAYKMSRFLATILRKAFKPKYSVKNASAFIRMVRRETLNKDNVLVSFDVVNCFGNIPTELALEIIERDFTVIAEHTPLCKDDFLTMLRICLQHANYFVFEGKFYRQNLGMFMGSSLAPILVERVIEDIVEKSLTQLNLKPDFWATYVDDHLTSIPRNMVDTLVNKLNSFHPKVQFTVEIEDEGTKSINFLDTTVFNRDGKLITRWYYKKIASNRLLNFHSCHPKNMILNVARAFIRRVMSLTHRSFRQESITTAKEILVKNCFPEKTINELIHQVNCAAFAPSSNTKQSYAFMQETGADNSERSNISNDLQNSNIINRISWSNPAANSTMINPQSNTEKKVYVGMTYIPKLTEKVSKQVKKHAPNLCTAPRPMNKVGNLFTDTKQKLTVDQNSMVVYDIPCGGCHGQKGYVGETTWNLGDRCGPPGGHSRDLKNIEKNPRSTALVHHVATTKHEFNFAEKRILKKVRHPGILKIHETNQILLHEGYAINFKKDAEHVSPMFYNLLKQSERNLKSKFKSKCQLRITAGTPKYKY